jgi:hypothetical protein
MHRWLATRMLATVVALTCALPGIHAQAGRAGQRGTPPVDAVGVTPNEIQQMFDAYFLVRAQEVLQLRDEQYPPFLTRLRALQAIRRRAENQRRQTVNQLRRLIQPSDGLDEATIKERLKSLNDLDANVALEARRAQDSLDEVLDLRQQARFRVLEEEMERRKVELVMRTRQANRPRPQ